MSRINAFRRLIYWPFRLIYWFWFLLHISHVCFQVNVTRGIWSVNLLIISARTEQTYPEYQYNTCSWTNSNFYLPQLLLYKSEIIVKKIEFSWTSGLFETRDLLSIRRELYQLPTFTSASLSWVRNASPTCWQGTEFFVKKSCPTWDRTNGTWAVVTTVLSRRLNK